MSHAWFYSDSQRQQQGPVADSYLFNAYQRGEVTLSSLVWREGMAQWAPLSQVAAELGISIAAPPSSMPSGPPPSQPRAVVVPPKKSGNGCLIIGIILLVGLVVVGGILAAIAIPAYNDYVQRARVIGAVAQGNAMKPLVSAFYVAHDRCPVNGDEGFSAATDYATQDVAVINIGSLDDGRCAVQIVFKDLQSHGAPSGEIVYAMDNKMEWTTTSTLPDKLLPSYLRN